MCDLLLNFLNILNKIDWPSISSILQGVAGIWIAFVATIALTSWRREIKTQKNVDFIDKLTDTVHEFILSMSAPVRSIEFAKIGIDSHSGIHNDSEDIKNSGAVAFIKEQGKFTKDSIQEQLKNIRPILIKMKSLVAKGQVLGIKDYFKCQKACSMLEWSYNQIEAFSSLIGNTSLNWRHPEVQQTLDKILLIDPEKIEKNLIAQNSEYLLFARQAYENILK